VNEDLARVAAAKGHAALARWSAGQAAEVHTGKRWRIPQSLRNLLEAPWYAAAPELADPGSELAAHAQGATRIIYDDCPRYDGTYLGTFVAKSGKPMIKVAVRRGNRSVELVSPVRGLTDGSDLKVGDAVTIGVVDDSERATIFEIRGRAAGARFDCLDEVTGVIDHQNREKSLASVYVTAERFCLLPYQEFAPAAAWAPGAAVRVRCVMSNGQLRAYHVERGVLKFDPWIQRVQGAIAIHPNGFGFVDDVFVPPHIARSYENGQNVALVAVRRPNRKTGVLGWAAISAADVPTDGPEEYERRG
jgi:hypothetical protein